MFLADYHMHTDFSPDAHFPMLEMAEAAAEKGMTQICFTDHIDIERCTRDGVYYDPDAFFPKLLPMRKAFEQLADRSSLPDLRFGIELSAVNHRPEDAKRIAACPELDFIIGSVHNLRDTNDFYFLDYSDIALCRALFRRYITECLETVDSGSCDVLGHFGYANRYMIRQGQYVDPLEFTDEIRELFRAAVRKGIGIEVNTSGLRDALGSTIPSLPVLKLYRECGGEIVTAGSDAHTPEAAGAGIREAYDLLAQAGFRYVSVFKTRRYNMIRLDKAV